MVTLLPNPMGCPSSMANDLKLFNGVPSCLRPCKANKRRCRQGDRHLYAKTPC